MQRSVEPDADRDVGLWTAWLIRTLANEVRPDLGAATYRPGVGWTVPPRRRATERPS